MKLSRIEDEEPPEVTYNFRLEITDRELPSLVHVQKDLFNTPKHLKTNAGVFVQSLLESILISAGWVDSQGKYVREEWRQ